MSAPADTNVVALASVRRERIGGSDAAAACGVDPHRSRIMLWAELTGRVVREPTEAMRWGNVLEPLIVAELIAQGYRLEYPAGLEYFDAERPWLRGHPDGFAHLSARAGDVLEVKTSGEWERAGWFHGAGVPLKYVAQVQHYLHLMDGGLALLACLIGGQRLVTRIVPRDDAAIAAMLHLEADMVDHVRRDEPLAPDGSDSARDALRALYPTVGRQAARADRELAQVWREAKDLKYGIDVRKRQLAERTQRLQAAMGDAELLLSLNDARLARWSHRTETRLDQTAIKERRPDVYAEFAVTKEHRRFELL